MFKVDFEVRDNELDAQGVVNNANYFIYMAHARHKYLHDIGIDFSEMTANKQNLFLVSANIEYKRPLRANEKFYVTCKLVPFNPGGKVRFAFDQEVRKIDTDELMAKGLNVGVCVDGNNRNRAYVPEKIKALFPLAPLPIQDEPE